MTITTRTLDHVLLVQVEGHLVFETEARVRDRVAAEIAGDTVGVVLDLQCVDLVDSSGLGCLLRVRELLRSAGARLTLLHVPPRVRTLLALTKLSPFFDTVDTEAAALRSSGPNAALETGGRHPLPWGD